MGLSLHEGLNNTDELSLDEYGKPCEGTRLSFVTDNGIKQNVEIVCKNNKVFIVLK